MKRILGLVLFSTLCWASPVVPPPACVTDSLKAYIALGANGCSEFPIPAPLRFADFQFAQKGPLDSSQIKVIPSNSGFSGGLSFLGGFAASTAESAAYLIAFTLDPPPIIHGFESDLFTLTPKSGGRAIVITELCVGAAFSAPLLNNSCKGTLETLKVFYDSSTPVPTVQLVDRVKFDYTAVLGVRNTVLLEGGLGTSDIAGFGNTSFIPEPSTLSLLAAGIALLLFRRRRP